jgi:hypothetical protein
VQAESAVLRVHAMHVRRSPNMAGSPYDGLRIKTTLEGGLLDEMRSAGIKWLARALAGDALAAELLLLQLTTRCAGSITVMMFCNLWRAATLLA